MKAQSFTLRTLLLGVFARNKQKKTSNEEYIRELTYLLFYC